jgi:uncharacterized protein YndB with AHSA1/START domain
VFAYFVDTEHMSRWFGKRHELDPRPGGVFRVEVSDGNVALGTFREITPHRRVAFTWGWEGCPDLPPGRSLVEIELIPKDGGTLVRLRHSGLIAGATLPFSPEMHAERWEHHLTELKGRCGNDVPAGRTTMNVIQERDTTTIRQTIVFNATPNDVYEMMMDSKKHQSLSGESADISREVGGRFSAWTNHLTGFNLVLRPGEKIVQAWRADDWWPEHYSIATFEIRKVEAGTELKFTQVGVPPHRFDGHTRGWIETYWRPMQDLFDRGQLSDQTKASIAEARKKLDISTHF